MSELNALKDAITALEDAFCQLEKLLGIDKKVNNASTSSTQVLYEDDNGEFTATDIVQGRKIKGKVRPKSVSDRFQDPNYGIKNVRMQ